MQSTPHFTAPRSAILISAAIAGLAGNLLLRGGQWRAGFALWIAGLALTVCLIGGHTSRERMLLLVGIAAAALGLACRDAQLLYAIDMLSVLCMGALLIWQGTGRSLRDLTLVRTLRVGVISALNTVGGAARLLAYTDVDAATSSATRRNIRALTIGIAIAALPLFLVTGLLSASDIVFNRLLDTVFSTVVSDGLSHLAIAMLLAWITAGWIRAALGHPIGNAIPDPRSPGLPFISLSVVLYALLVLLLAFVITQARVLFGGAEFLRVTENLSVATYARDGFFQLIAASGVVLATLVMAEWLLSDDDTHARRRFQVMSAMLLALVALLLVSSAARILLYINDFGLSVDRAFASAAIVWVFGVLVTFAVTTLRGHSDRFMSTAIVVTVAWVTLLNLANPEALIVHVNVARAVEGKQFDASYHAQLSADSLPAMRSLADTLPPADCDALNFALRASWAKRLADPEEGRGDWRSSNLPLLYARAWFAALPPPACQPRALSAEAGARSRADD